MEKSKGSIMALAAASLLNGLPDFATDEFGRAVRKGPRPNKYTPKPTKVKNPKVAAQVQAMHDLWVARAFKVFFRTPADPNSITSIKLKHHVHRSVARELKAAMPV